MLNEIQVQEKINALKAKNETLQKWLEDNLTVNISRRQVRRAAIECNQSKIQMLEEVIAS